MKRKYTWLILFSIFGMLLSTLFVNMSTSSSLTTELNIYLSPNGVDSNDGLSAGKSVLTLNRAHQIVDNKFKSGPVNVIVHVSPGVYYGQMVVWKAVHPNYSIKIYGTNPNRKTIFDGRINSNQTTSNIRSFFNLRAAGKMTNLTIQNLNIRYYAEAISFSGDRDDLQNGFNGKNKILYNIFDKIGSYYHSEKSKPAYAVVRFVNSRENQVIGNIFTNIKNATEPALLHSLYIAHYSGHNVIEGNAFRNYSGDGDPIRIRDYSNFNRIEKNQIDRTNGYGYSEWYCESRTISGCSKEVDECPSWGSLFRYNVLKGVSLFGIYVNRDYNPATSNCRLPIPTEANSKRLSTARNEYNDKKLVVSYVGSNPYNGLCSTISSCVSSTGSCYLDTRGTSKWLCANNKWLSCSGSIDLGKSYKNIICKSTGTGYSWDYPDVN